MKHTNSKFTVALLLLVTGTEVRNYIANSVQEGTTSLFVEARCPFAGSFGDLIRKPDGLMGGAEDITRSGVSGLPFLENGSEGRPDNVNKQYKSRPNPRKISNIVCKQCRDKNDEWGLSHMVMQWGQFVDHDFTDMAASKAEQPLANINVPKANNNRDDIHYGTKLKFTRAEAFPSAGASARITPGIRNLDTAFIDASMVYGSSVEEDEDVRASIEGSSRRHYLLKVTDTWEGQDLNGDLPPLTEEGDKYIFGDGRGNVAPTLMAMHTLFIREHNRLAVMVHKRKYRRQPDVSLLTDEQIEDIYQEARIVVEAEMQAITYEEWLPAQTGRKLKYSNPDTHLSTCSSVDPQMETWFSGAFFRYGHSQVQDKTWRLQCNKNAYKKGLTKEEKKRLKMKKNEKVKKKGKGKGKNKGIISEQTPKNRLLGKKNKKFSMSETMFDFTKVKRKKLGRGCREHPAGHYRLATMYESAYNNAINILSQTNMEIEPLLAGLAYQPNQAIDVHLTDAVRDHLFRIIEGDVEKGYSRALDLASLNIQRGRDLGIRSFPELKYYLTGQVTRNFNDITKNKKLRKQLKRLYKKVTNVDVFVGMLAEDHLPQASMGPTLRAALENQFSRIQQSDCFWYKIRLACGIDEPSTVLKGIKKKLLNGKYTLADVISANTYLNFPKGYNVFVTRDHQNLPHFNYPTPSGNLDSLYGTYEGPYPLGVEPVADANPDLEDEADFAMDFDI